MALDLDTTKHHNPERPTYILLHKDESHVYSASTGAVWSHETKDLELVQKILKEDFGVCNYYIIELQEGLVRIGNVQAELVRLWTPTINAIRKERNLEKRRHLYANFMDRHKAPHPLEADALLKKYLKW
jgi:hypothetical protein